jgi:hypothetical protein
MNASPNQTRVSKFVLLIALALASASAVAGGIDDTLPVAYPIEETRFETTSCIEAAQSAWFQAQFALGDGEVRSGAASLDCTGEVYAAASEGE